LRIDLDRARKAAFLLVWWIGAAAVLFAVIELVPTALFWARGGGHPTPTDPAEVMTTARTRLRIIPTPNVAAPGVHTDRDGWRVRHAGESLFSDYSESDYNIVMFGGSTTWGSSVRDDETLPAQLQSLAETTRARDGRRVRIFNAGLPTYSLDDEIHLLADFLRQGRRIDLAIFYDGVNEECIPAEPPAQAAAHGDRIEVQHPDYLKIRDLMALANARSRIIPENFRVVRLLRQAWHRLPGGAPDEISHGEWLRRAEICAQAYLSNARFAQRLARAWQMDVMFVLQPAGAFLANAATIDFPSEERKPQREVDALRALYRRILADAPASGLAVSDWSGMLEAPFGRGEALFVDPDHLTGHGNAIVARAFHEALVASGRLSPAPAGRN